MERRSLGVDLQARSRTSQRCAWHLLGLLRLIIDRQHLGSSLRRPVAVCPESQRIRSQAVGEDCNRRAIQFEKRNARDVPACIDHLQQILEDEFLLMW